MTYRQLVLLILAAAALSLPFTLSACGGPNPSNPDDRSQKQDPDRKDPPAAKQEEKKADEKPQERTAAAEYRLPDDAGGKLVSRLVEPTQRPPERESRKSRLSKTPTRIDNPHAPLPPQVASLPRLPDAPRRPLLPQVVAPEPLFGMEEVIGGLPHALSFPAQERVRIESEDVARPVALPRQAQPLSDRAAVADPTADVSRSAALSAPLPERETPAPFQRITLPDPFENQETVKLNVPDGEETLPDGTVRLPKK